MGWWLRTYKTALWMSAMGGRGFRHRGGSSCCSGTGTGLCILHRGEVCPDTGFVLQLQWALSLLREEMMV